MKATTQPNQWKRCMWEALLFSSLIFFPFRLSSQNHASYTSLQLHFPETGKIKPWLSNK